MRSKNSPPSNTITFVKYANRRIYDTETSEYVSFQDIRARMIKGRDILVLDNKTKEDVTREVLISLIQEAAVGGEPLFSEDLMKQLIRFYGNPLQSSLMTYFEQGQKVLETFWSGALSANKTPTDASKE